MKPKQFSFFIMGLTLTISLLVGCSEASNNYNATPSATASLMHTPSLTRTPWNTYVRLPSYTYGPSPTPRPTRTSTIIGSVLTPTITLTPTPYIFPYDTFTPEPTSTYQFQSGIYPEYSLYYVCEDAVIRINAMPNRAPYYTLDLSLENPIPLVGPFDPNDYFNILTNIKMENGYSLDYIYTGGEPSGLPILYARAIGQPRLSSYEEYMMLIGETDFENYFHRYDYLSHVVLDGTPTSYLQFTLLRLMGDRFYYYYRSSYLNPTTICGVPDVQRRFGALHNTFLPNEILEQGETLDLNPTVTIGTDIVEVRLVQYSGWIGFYERIFWISRTNPHIIVDQYTNYLVPYVCDRCH